MNGVSTLWVLTGLAGLIGVLIVWLQRHPGDKASHPRRQEPMRAPMSMMWFVLLGALGFGIGGAIGFFSPWGILLSGALGGASLGLAFKDVGRVVSLAVLGLVGLAVGAVGLLQGFFLGIPVRLGLYDDSPSSKGAMVVGVKVAKDSSGIHRSLLAWRGRSTRGGTP